MQEYPPSTPAPQNANAAAELPAGGMARDWSRDYRRPAAAPRVLLTATLRWPIAARLAIAFAGLGCQVEAICPRQHPVTKTRALRRCYLYTALKPLVSLRAAIASSAPDLIIPCDDNAALDLHRLHACLEQEGPSASATRLAIARSLGSPEACALATARGKFMALAGEEGVRVPETRIVATLGELQAWGKDHRFPSVIKVDCTWGGQGVHIVQNHAEAESVLAHILSRPAIVNEMARSLRDREPSFVLNSLKGETPTITVQDFITGTPANRAVACWRGRVLAGISVKAIRTQHPTGPATVVRVIENSEMTEAADTLVRRLGISGLWGIDFMLQESSGAAYAIEMNPRATPICHLALATGANLPAALCRQLPGGVPVAQPATIEHRVIALFPGEWQRNPASAYLRSGYHDVPWDEPALIQDCVSKPWSERGLIARLWANIRPKLPMPSRPQKDMAGAGIAARCAHKHPEFGRHARRAPSTCDGGTSGLPDGPRRSPGRNVMST